MNPEIESEELNIKNPEKFKYSIIHEKNIVDFLSPAVRLLAEMIKDENCSN